MSDQAVAMLPTPVMRERTFEGTSGLRSGSAVVGGDRDGGWGLAVEPGGRLGVAEGPGLGLVVRRRSIVG